MPKPSGLTVPLCTYFGNECFRQKFTNTTQKLGFCDCLPGCNEISYKYIVDSVKKFTPDEVDSICGGWSPHYMVTQIKYF